MIGAEKLEIAACQVTSATYMRRLSAVIFADNWLWLVAPVAVCAMLAYMLDVRFLIVALMVLFIVLPMILALLYFYYGLSPEAGWSIMEKTLAIDDKGITLTFTDERMKKHVIGWDDVRSIIEEKDVWLLMLRGKRYTCLMLPTSVINPDVAQALRQFAAQAH